MSRESAARTSLLVGIVLLLMTLTFPSFFLFSPFDAGINVLGLFQFASIIGWFAMVIFPPVILNSKAEFAGTAKTLFLVTALIWPAAIVLIRITLLIQTANPYLNYLVQYPIFIFSDAVVPILYIVLWRRMSALAAKLAAEQEETVVPVATRVARKTRVLAKAAAAK